MGHKSGPSRRPVKLARGNGALVVFITAPSNEEAARLGRKLVEEGLAACANLVPAVRSIYKWEGRVCDDQEVLLIVKTRRSRFKQVAETVKALHSYTVPEIVAFPLEQGSADYLKWLWAMTANTKK